MAFYINYFNFDWFNIFHNFIWEDLLVVFFLYNFLKYIILCTMNELIWPTHFFNRKHTSAYTLIRFRTFVEYFNKLEDYSLNYYIINSFWSSYMLGYSNLKKFMKK